MYKRARFGEIPNFTGIGAPFEAPENPEVVLNSGDKSVEDCVAQLITYLKDGGYFSLQNELCLAGIGNTIILNAHKKETP